MLHVCPLVVRSLGKLLSHFHANVHKLDKLKLSHKLQICTKLEKTTLNPELCLTYNPIIQYMGKKVYHDFWSAKHQGFPKIIIFSETISKLQN